MSASRRSASHAIGPCVQVTPDAIRDEPELEAWTRGGERLMYTFNPVVSLRAIAAHGLAAEAMARLGEWLPLLDTAAVGELLTAEEPRRILLGLFAACAMNAGALALVVAPLQAHPDRTISCAAERYAARAAGRGRDDRTRADARRHADSLQARDSGACGARGTRRS